MSNIIFNNKNYSIDDSFLSIHSNDLKQHLSTVMNGTGAIIKLGDVAYNVDATKLATAKSAFIQHLGAIAGNGYKVIIGGVEYNIDASKVANAITGLDAAWEDSQSGDGDSEINGFPIRWNTMDVIGNTTVVVENYPFVKVSDFIPSPEQLENSELVAINQGQEMVIGLAGFEFIKNNILAVVLGNFMIAFIYEAGEIPELDVAFPETGVYALDYGSMAGANIDFVINYADGIRDGYVYEEGDYVYTYSKADGGWSVRLNENVVDKHQTFYGEILESIKGEPIVNMCRTFDGCRKMIEAPEIPNGVINIEEAFNGCTSLTSAPIIPNSVTIIGDRAFANCENLVSIVIPNSVIEIKDFAFVNCQSLTNIEIPDNVTKIGHRAFGDCSSLTSIIIPAKTEVSNRSFDNCTNLMSINAHIDNQFYESIDGVLFSKDKTVIIMYPAGKVDAYTIPEGVEKIDSYAFAYCKNLTTVNIPNSVRIIRDSAFYDCTGLTSLIIPNSVTEIGYYAFNGCSNLSSVNIPDGVTTIKFNTFSECTALTSITIHNNVKTIESDAFYRCTGLEMINFAGTIEQWNNISIRGGWNTDVPATEVICSDGVVSLI